MKLPRMFHRHPAAIWMLALVAALLMLPSVPVRAGSVVPQVDCSALAVPDKTEQTVVASRIVIDNHPVSIISARNALAPADFAAFYKNLWTGNGAHPLYVENTIGPWDVVAHKDGACFYTVQIATGRSYTAALISVGTPDSKVSVRSALDFPAPGDAHPLTHMVSQDGGTLGETWVLYTSNSAAATLDYYHRTLGSLGWLPLMPSAAATHGRGTLLMYRKGSQDVGLVVAPFERGGSTITFTVMSR
ncbi:hypothetical protein [Rhodanobacter umsongensis]